MDEQIKTYLEDNLKIKIEISGNSYILVSLELEGKFISSDEICYKD